MRGSDWMSPQDQSASQKSMAQNASANSAAAVPEPLQKMTFRNYDPEGFFDEMFTPDGQPRPEAQLIVQRIESLAPGELVRRQKAIDRSLLRMGITFAVYGSEQGTEKIWPFDIVPRIVPAAEWDRLDLGL